MSQDEATSVRPVAGRGLSLVAAVIFVVIALVVVSPFLHRGKLLQTSASPDGDWQVEVYLLDAGATTGGTLRVFAHPIHGRRHEIARFAHLENLVFSQVGQDELWPGQLEIQWLGADSVRIGGHELDPKSADMFRDY